jgi:hypothetical protein
MAKRWPGGRLSDIRSFIDRVPGHDLHAKRVDRGVGATLGVMTSASRAVAVIGQALTQARGRVIQRVDRLLTIRKVLSETACALSPTFNR